AERRGRCAGRPRQRRDAGADRGMSGCDPAGEKRAMSTVSFTRMMDGTREDYELLEREEQPFFDTLPDRLLAVLGMLEGTGGYQVTRLEHCLQTASRAERDGADEEMVVAALLHDIGDVLAPHNHAEVAASVLRPYVREEVHWIVRHHYAFQLYYYG